MKSILVKILAATVSLLFYASSTNADSYDAATGQLTIPSVLVGSTTYSNVVLTVGSVVSIGAGPAVGTVDSYDAAANQLTIPTVSVGNTTYTNVVIVVGSVLSIGAAGNGSFSPLSPITIASNVGLTTPYGLDADNQYYYVSNYGQSASVSAIYKFDINTGAYVGTIPTPSQWPTGPVFDGTNLWLIDYDSNLRSAQFYQLSASSGAIISSFPIQLPGAWSSDMAFDGSFLYFGSGNKIYKYDRSGNLIGVVATLAANVTPPSVEKRILAMTFLNGELVVSLGIFTGLANSYEIARVNPTDGSVIAIAPTSLDVTGLMSRDGVVWGISGSNTGGLIKITSISLP